MDELKTVYQKVAYLIDNVPQAADNYKLLILLYWQVFDNIDIPRRVIKEIAERGTEPESINREKRNVLKYNLTAAEVDALLDEMYEDLNAGKD
jgi:hypothetical protein